MIKKIDNVVTPLNVAETLGVVDKYLEAVAKQELNEEYIQSEISKTEFDFFESDFVVFPV